VQLQHLPQSIISSMAAFVALTTLAIAPARAADFNLSGKFSPPRSPEFLQLYPDLAPFVGGSFDGTYSAEGLPPMYEQVINFPDWKINLRNAAGTVLATSSPTLLVPQPRGAAIGPHSRDPNAIRLLFGFPTERNNLTLDIEFPQDFNGEGIAIDDGIGGKPGLRTQEALYYDALAYQDTSSTPVPEPSTFLGAAIASGMVWRMRKRIRR
jgi:hypothetical protein